MIRFSTALVLTTFSVLSFATDTNCFNPENNKTIQTFLTPNELQVLLLTPKKDENTIGKKETRLNEDAAAIKKMHDKIREAYNRDGIDPRLLYGLMIGESQGNPFASVFEDEETKKKEVAGLFSLRGNVLKEMREACEKAKQPRLCQLNYYIDQFIPDQKSIMDVACKEKKWENLSQAEKFSYIGFDSCNSMEMAKRVCLSERKYQNSGACSLISEVINWTDPKKDKPNKIPLCDDYINPPKSLDKKVVVPAAKKVEP